MQRRRFLAGASTWAMAAALPRVAFAQAGSGAPIRIVYPFAAGSAGDAIVRVLAESLRQETGRTVIVENRTGGEGRIGVRAVASATPDGSTLLFTPFAPMTLFPSVYNDLGYDPFKDFTPVTQVSRYEFALSSGPLVPATRLKDVAGWLRAHPDQASFGVTSNAGLPYFTARLFMEMEKIEAKPVVYRGQAQVVSDVAGGHLALASTGASEVSELARAGKLHVLATTGTERSRFLPDVPTYKELGYDIIASGWYALFAPSGTPSDVVARYNAICVKTILSPEGRETVHRLEMEPGGTSAQELGEIQRRDFERWAGPIKLYRP